MHFPVTQHYLLNQTRMRRTGLFLAIIFLLSLTGVAVADQVTHLYEASVPVENQHKDQRMDAIRAAFTQVLTRVSGRSDIANAQEFPAISRAIDRATRYAQQYRYIKTTPAAEGQSPGLALWVRFDETALGKLLRSNHLPVWGATRPATLLWLVIDKRGRRELLGADTQNETRSILGARAKLRGVPLRLPLLDLTDRTKLRVSDVWGNFESTILQASQRYKTEAVLVGRVFQSYGAAWTGRWTLYVDSGREDWTVTGSSLADVLNPGIDKTAEDLALRYTQVYQVSTGKVLVEVKAIKDLADYNRVMKYLQSISHVTAVQPVELMAKSAVFQITIPGGRLAVASAVSLGNVLASEPDNGAPVASIPAANATSTNNAGNTNIVSNAGNATNPNNPGETNNAVNAGNTINASNANQPDPGLVVADLTYRLVQ